MSIGPGGYLPNMVRPLNSGADIILYTGQSNDVGWGIGDFTDSDNSLDGRCFQIGRFFGANMTVIPMVSDTDVVNPLHFWEYDKGRGFGLTFARLYAANILEPGRAVILIPAAHGLTSILQWLGLIAGTGEPLYSDMAARINLALATPGSRIVAWIENQGETDANIAAIPSDPNHALMPNAATYKARKLDLIDKVRAEFGTFPMIFGLFCDAWVGTNAGRLAFEQAIRDAASERQMCAVTETSGLQSNHDVDPTQFTGHFSAAAQEELAPRHFATYCNLLGL